MDPPWSIIYHNKTIYQVFRLDLAYPFFRHIPPRSIISYNKTTYQVFRLDLACSFFPYFEIRARVFILDLVMPLFEYRDSL